MLETLKNDLEKYTELPAVIHSEEELVNALADQVQYLIDHNLDGLYSLLYRIDVYESKVRNIIAAKPYREHAREIALLIIERQKEKIETRKKFSS